MENDNKKKGEIQEMKEIIYLDTKLVNSLLAQTDTGLLTKIIKETSNSNSTSKSKTKTTTFSTRLKAAFHILGGSISKSEAEAELFTQATLVGSKDLKEAVMDDYSLEVLLENLHKKNLIKAGGTLDGDIIISTDILSAYNFEVLLKTLELKDLPEFRKDYMKNKKAYNIQDMQNRLVYAEAMFKNTTIIKIGDYISFCDNENLRLSYPQLFFNGFSNKEFHLLGILISKKIVDVSYIESLKNKPQEIFKNFSAIAFQALLQENYIIEIESSNFIVRPIAIYSVMK